MKKNKLVELCLKALEDAKALNVNVFDVRKLTSIADYMIVASGRSNRQVSAIADKIVETAKQNGFQPLGVEGQREGEWVLVDLGDVIVHIMHPETREYYQLEKLWNMADTKRAENN